MHCNVYSKILNYYTKLHIIIYTLNRTHTNLTFAFYIPCFSILICMIIKTTALLRTCLIYIYILTGDCPTDWSSFVDLAVESYENIFSTTVVNTDDRTDRAKRKTVIFMTFPIPFQYTFYIIYVTLTNPHTSQQLYIKTHVNNIT